MNHSTKSELDLCNKCEAIDINEDQNEHERRCIRCDKPIIKAGIIVAGKTVCSACSHYFSEPRPCSNCGRLSRRLSRAPRLGFNDPVCMRCRTCGFETCSLCHRYREVFIRDDRQRPLCAKCAIGSPSYHPCPICGESILGGGGLCQVCALQDRIQRRVRLNLELLEQPWVRTLFDGFCTWDGLHKVAGNMTARIDKYAVIFAEIDRNCTSQAELSQRRLFDIFGAEGLRRGFLVVSFLCERTGIDWRIDSLEEMTEITRINRQLGLWRNRPWIERFQQFIDELQAADSPKLKAKTIRMYQTAAGLFLDKARVQSPDAITQDHLDHYLVRHKGQAANLSPFIRHLRDVYQIDLKLKKPQSMSLQQKDRTLIRRVKLLTHGLEAATDKRAAKALLAALLADLYQIPMKHVLAIRKEEVLVINSNKMILWPSTLDIRIEGRIATLFRYWLLPSDESPFIFCGRNGVQPLSYDTVRYHARRFLHQ